VHATIGVDPDQVVVEGGMMASRERDAVGEHRLAESRWIIAFNARAREHSAPGPIEGMLLEVLLHLLDGFERTVHPARSDVLKPFGDRGFNHRISFRDRLEQHAALDPLGLEVAVGLDVQGSAQLGRQRERTAASRGCAWSPIAA
jgi:hypothetical protein